MNEIDPRVDSRRLRTDAYADSTRLRQRVRLHDHALRRVDFATWALEHAPIPRDARVLDVGCGPGEYLRRLSDARVGTIGVDLSIGMATEARAHACTMVADAQRLPFADATFDVILAMHMLYHVPDVDLAIAEFRRVLRPGGALVVSTNGSDHMHELRALMTESARQTGVGTAIGARSFERVNLENVASFAERHFSEVTRHEHRDVIEVDDATLVIDYINSLRGLYADSVPAKGWPTLIDHATRILGEHLDKHGRWRTQQHAGVVVFHCR